MLKELLSLLVLLCSVSTVYSDYKRITDYQNILYGLTEDYVMTNSTSSSAAVLEFLYSSATATVFKDAQAAGYTRKDLIFGTYQSAFGVANPRRVIINALHDAVVQENRLYDGAFYSSYVAVGASGVLIIGGIRYFWVYFRWIRPALIHYHANHHLFATVGSSTTTRIPLYTNATTPLVPEPSF